MAAATYARNTPARSGDRREPPVKGSARLFGGCMVAIDAAGLGRGRLGWAIGHHVALLRRRRSHRVEDERREHAPGRRHRLRRRCARRVGGFPVMDRTGEEKHHA